MESFLRLVSVDSHATSVRQIRLEAVSSTPMQRKGRRPQLVDSIPRRPGILSRGEVAERLMAALLKSAESKDFVGSNPTLSARS
jgi:hypothetical protein